MSQTTGLTTISEEDIARHQAVAQSMVTRVVVLVTQDGSSSTPLAGTNRRFVSTVSTRGMRKTREIELGKTTDTFRVGAGASAIEELSFSLITHRITLDLEASARMERQALVEGFTMLLRGLGR